MKRFLALAALVLGMVSCQTEPEGLDVNVGGEQDVNITVSLPEGTRADSALGAFANVDFDEYDVRFQCEVHYGDQVKVLPVQISDNGKEATFPVRLIANRDYKFVVWADLVKQGETTDLHYITSTPDGLAKISINDWAPMDETRDAFTCSEVRRFERNTDITLTLKRPFAKLRVITTDMKELMGVVPAKAEVEYTTEYRNSFDAVEGKAGDAQYKKTHNLFEIASYDETGTDKTLFADYLFASEGDIVNFSMNIYDQNGDLIDEQKNFNTPIPVKRNYLTTIKGNILTYADDFDVVINPAFDGEDAYVDSRNAAQSTLDNAIANTTIYLEPGVNYGTLYLRPVAGGAQTKVVDWVGNNYRFETYSLFENLTIVGAEGATVDAIKIEGGTYYNTDHSQKDTYPVMLSLIELKNVVFDGVTFTGKGGYDPQGYGNAVNLSGNNIKVDGLTFKNCVLNNSENNARLLYKTESTTHVHTYAYNGETYTFTPSLKNITITDCTLNGGYMGLELREAENVTITNNEFNVADRNILLPVNTGCTYSGNITITGNVSNNAKERFVRADGTGDAVVVISNNTLNNYQGADADYIKVTNGNNVTIENNILISNISTAAEFISALNANGYYVVINDITISGPQTGTLATRANDNKESVIDLNGYTITFENLTAPVETIEAGNSVTFVGEGSLVVVNSTTSAIVNEGTVVDETFNVTDEIISGAGVVEYEVSDKEGLISFADAVKDGNTFEGQTIELTADIDLTGVTTNGDSFSPIGLYCSGQGVNKPFEGHFDGQGHTIKGIYQSGWDFGYEWGRTGYLGLFGYVKDATIENLTIEGMESVVEGGTLAAIAGRADGECTFKNITVKDTDLGSYNNRCGGIVGWTGGYYKDEAQTEVACHFTFENINICEDVVLGGLWGSFDTSIGGIMGQLNSVGSASFKNVTVSCRIDAYNDCTASYDYYLYRMCGMLIGQMTKTTTIDGSTYPDVAAYGITFDNVTVNYGKWMNYHYCEPTPGLNGGRGMRVEAGFTYDGLPADYDHSQCVDNHYNCIPFDQLFGGTQTACKGVKAWEGVTVNYPAAYTCDLCGETHNN